MNGIGLSSPIPSFCPGHSAEGRLTIGRTSRPRCGITPWGRIPGDQKVAQLPGEGIAGPADHQGRRAECYRDGAALLLAGPALDANYESVKLQIFDGAPGLIVWLRIREVPKPEPPSRCRPRIRGVICWPLRLNGRPQDFRPVWRRREPVMARFGRPIIALLDTPGAWPQIDAGERGQAGGRIRRSGVRPRSRHARESVSTPALVSRQPPRMRNRRRA